MEADMATMSATHARRHFADLLGLAEKTPVYVERNGRRVAVVLSVDSYEALLATAPKAGVSPLVKKLFAKELEKRGPLYEALARGPRTTT
jgi:prevent-host-death family protein